MASSIFERRFTFPGPGEINCTVHCADSGSEKAYRLKDDKPFCGDPRVPSSLPRVCRYHLGRIQLQAESGSAQTPPGGSGTDVSASPR